MVAFGIVRVTISQLSAMPMAVVLAIGLLVSSPAVALLVPIGISSGDVRQEDWIYELAFMGMVLGCAAATGVLEKLFDLLSVVSPDARLISQFSAISSVGLFGALLPLLPLLAIRGNYFSLGGSVSLDGFFLLWVTLAVGGAALLRMHLAPSVPMWALGMSTLFAPIVLPDPSSPRTLAALAAALLSAAWLLDHPPERAT